MDTIRCVAIVLAKACSSFKKMAHQLTAPVHGSRLQLPLAFDGCPLVGVLPSSGPGGDSPWSPIRRGGTPGPVARPSLGPADRASEKGFFVSVRTSAND